MTNNQLTREENVQAVFDLKAGYTLGLADVEILKRVARMALAAMDSESVAVPDHLTYLQNPTLENVLSDDEENSPMAHAARILAREVKFWRSAPLYLHAQQPVVPDEILCEFYEVDSWPDLVRELVKHVEQLQDSAKRNVKPWEDTFPETLLPAYIDRIKQADEAYLAAMLQAVNSPVIPEGCVMVPKEPTKEMIDAGWLYFMGAKNPSSKGAYKAMLAAAPQEVQGE
ncbi:hypothetical protein [Raoultella ornithinolytica]|uniref:hypothetical protein n=1 Tax=Raoultella ornithinolytica TaxID=54291 RepID=UPI00190A8C74|nr:hypothetical protein [Raoultella ornithinolytica]MBK2610797.1 hypothetical protein [Raoultella ornithinolytica]